MRAPWLPPEEERRGLLRFGRKRVAHESDGDVDAATDSASASASDGGSDPKQTGGSPKRSEGSTSRAGKTSDDTGAKKPAAPSTPPWLTGVRAPILGDDDDIAAPSDNVRPNDPEPDPSDSADQQDRYSESAQDEDSGAFESQTDFDQHEGIASLKFSLPPLSDEGIESESVSDYEGRESTLLEGSGGGRAISTALSDDAPTSPGPDLVVPDPLSRFGQLEAKLKQLGLDHSIPDRAAKHASQVESASVGESADGDSGSVEVSSDVADSGVGVDDSLGALGLEYPVSEFGEAAGVAPDTDTEGDAWYAGTGGAVLGGDAGDISEVVESASVGESADGDSGSVEVSSDVADSGVGVDDS
ncbi:hypothetical protein, partial [Mycobacteroides abscessus]